MYPFSHECEYSGCLCICFSEAKARQVLHPPYGRPLNPTPLITEEEFVKGGLHRNLDETDEDPTLDYEYGFNPLTFLGEYVRWSHPDTVVSRRKAKEDAIDRLRFIANHGIRQLEVVDELKDILSQQGSGILWGPFTGPVSSTSILLICQPLQSGYVVVQLSEREDFSEISVQSETLYQKNSPSDASDESSYLQEVSMILPSVGDSSFVPTVSHYACLLLSVSLLFFLLVCCDVMCGRPWSRVVRAVQSDNI
jgi:hypothetical protein